VAELIATSPAQGLTPITVEGAHLSEGPMTPIWSIAPYHGRSAAVSQALTTAHGFGFPKPGTLLSHGPACIAWSGLDQAVLIGVVADARVATDAALSDQSDAWVRLILSGPSARAVLARLVPLDLSPAACPPGSARRTLVGHMPALILYRGGDAFEMLLFRSMAATAVAELSAVMKMVAARAAL